MPRRPVDRGRTARTNVAGSNRRLLVGRLLMVIALLLAGGKLVQVQGVQANTLAAKAEQQRITKDVIPADRGSIMDRHESVLAFSSEAKQLYATPRRMTETLEEAHAKDPTEPTATQHKQEAARFIARTTQGKITEKQVLDVLMSDDQFSYFGPEIDPAKAKEITGKFPQIGAEYRAIREYPAGNLAANVIGAANWRMDERKIEGQIGLEAAMDKTLGGRNGVKLSDTAMGSSLVIPGTERELKPAVPGSDVQLTVDSDVQFTVQRGLNDYARRANARSASAVVLDAKTGEVYALANDKTFDPGGPWNGNIGNPAVTTPFEPGSVNKVITAAGAIENDVIKPEDVLQVPGKIEVADRTVGDAWPHGTIPLTFTGVLGKSSNVGTIEVAQKLGGKKWFDLASKFGLGKSTGIGLPGESAGSLPPPKEWSGSSFANLPIGQGLSMTVLQMAGMYQTIANDGVRMPPRIVDATIRPDGTRVPTPDPKGVRVVSPKTANTVKDMLRAVVQDGPGSINDGTGKAAALEGYQLSGKTGTAQQYDPAIKGYSNEKYWITFAGMVPADNPRFVVGLMLDRPHGSEEATSAAPLFHELASYLTQHFQIPLSKNEAPFQVLQTE